MARLQVTVVVTTLFALIPVGASAQSVTRIVAGVKYCRALKDDNQRLECFDRMSAEQSPATAGEGTEGNKPERDTAWTYTESNSPADDSPQLMATLLSSSGNALLILRCYEKKTEALFSGDTFLGSSGGVRVLTHIGDGKPIDTTWSPSNTGLAVFAPSAISFIKALPDDTKLLIRAYARSFGIVDAQFALGKVSEVRERIAHACNWQG